MGRADSEATANAATAVGRSLSPKGGATPSAAGATVQGLRRAIEEMVGADVVARALMKVSPEVREEFCSITPLTWVPLTTVTTAIEQIAAEAHVAYDELMDDAVRRAAEQMFRTSWRLLLRITTDHALVARTPMMYSKWRNVGFLESRLVAPGQSEIVLAGWRDISERNVRTLAVAIETVMRLAGRRGVKIDWLRTSDGAKFKAHWRR